MGGCRFFFTDRGCGGIEIVAVPVGVRHGTQQFLGCDAGALAFDICFVHAREQGIRLDQCCVDLVNWAQGVRGWNEGFELANAYRALDEGVGAAHGGQDQAM